MAQSVLERVLRGGSLVMSGKITAAAFGFLTVMVMAGHLPVAEMGLYFFLLSTITILISFANLGTNEFILREGAARPAQAGSLLRASLGTKLILGVCGAFFVHLYQVLTGGSTELLLPFVLLFLALMIDSFVMSYISLYRARGNNRIEAVYFLLRGAARLAVVWFICTINPHLEPMLAGLLGVAVVLAVPLVAIYHKGELVSNHDWWRPRYFLTVLKAALPFAAVALLGNLYAQSLQLLLGLIRSNTELGSFGLAMQVFNLATFLPVSLYLVLQPILVDKTRNEDGLWAEKLRRLFLAAVILGAGVAAAIGLAGPWILELAFGDKYAPVTNQIRWLMPALALNFIWVVVIHPTLIAQRQLFKLNTMFSLKLVVLVLSGWVLIHRFGALGACYALIFGEITGIILGTWQLVMGRAALREQHTG